MNGKRQKIAYCEINAICICIAIVFVARDYKDAYRLFDEKPVGSILLLLLTVIIVHSIKAGRFYFALYGNNMRLKRYLKVYCKVTVVSNAVPFKLGEFFRMYCYGKETGSFLRSVVIVLLDRFMDTVALLVVSLSTWILFNGEQMNKLAMFLMFFLAVLMIIYFVFPGFYHYWKKWLLHAEASEHRLLVLKALENLQTLYQEINHAVKGKGVIMFGLSLIVWAVEIGSVMLINQIYWQNVGHAVLMEYLMAAMLNGGSEELSRFIFVSVLSLAFSYLILMFLCKSDRKEDNVQ